MNFISDILTFAYRGSGKSILLICVILSVIASIASFAPILGIIAWILFTGYFCSIFYQIIRSSAIGDMEAPNFPETSNILEDVIVPMLQVILVVMVSFAPYFVYTLFISSDHPDPMISNIFFGFGVIYFPMAMLAVVILGSTRALSPHIVLPAIFHGGWIYWGGVLMLTILYVLEMIFAELMQSSWIIGPLIMAVITSYTLMTNARILGLIYRERQSELNWLYVR